MYHTTLVRLTARLMHRSSRCLPAEETEDGFEVAQSMGIALLGLVVAAGFTALLEALGADIVDNIRTQLGM